MVNSRRFQDVSPTSSSSPPIPRSRNSPTPYVTPCRHLIPRFSLCFCLRLALAHFSSPYVYYGHRRHRQFCSSSPCPMHQHPSVHFSYPTPSIDPHTSIIIHAHLQSLLSCTYFPIPCFSRHHNFSNVGEDDVLHRLISVLTFVGFPGWTLHRFPSKSVSLFFLLTPHYWFIYFSALGYDPARPRLFHISVWYNFCIMCTCFWTYDTPHILLLFPPFPSPTLPLPSLTASPHPLALSKRVLWSLPTVKTSIFL